MNTFKKTYIGIMCAIVIAISATTTGAQAATTRQDIELQIKSMASLLTIAQSEPQYKARIVELVKKVLAQLLVDVKELDKEKPIVSVMVNGGNDKVIIKPKQGTPVKVTTSGEAISVNGDDNDYAEFEIEFSINSFGTTNYISENGTNSFNFEITDGTGEIVYESNGVQKGEVVASVSSEADSQGDYYRIDKGESEVFTLSATFNPYENTAVGSGSYRLRLQTVDYSKTPGGQTTAYIARPEKIFRTNLVNIVN